MNDGDLLQQLRIARDQREDDSRRPALAVDRRRDRAGLADCGGAAFFLLRGQAVAVQTATAVAPGGQRAGAVLQATGYVTARREATVSAQITGTLTEVLIEEGEHVKKGQVLARLDDTQLQGAV